jgi:hypothetical protein
VVTLLTSHVNKQGQRRLAVRLNMIASVQARTGTGTARHSWRDTVCGRALEYDPGVAGCYG